MSHLACGLVEPEQHGITGALPDRAFGHGIQGKKIGFGQGLVGKVVQYPDPGTGEMKSGEATNLFTIDGSMNLLVNGDTVPVTNVVGVSNS